MSTSNSFVSIPALVNVIGNVYKDPTLLDMEDKYCFNEYDFYDSFHRIIFSTIYNLHQLGVKEITLNAIDDYLNSRPKKKAIYEAQKGPEFISKAVENCSINTFDYYYGRMKKMSLLRAYNDELHMDLTWLYDPDNVFDAKKKQEQEEWLDNVSLVDITRLIDDKIEELKSRTINENLEEGEPAGKGLESLIEHLKDVPELGYPLFGPYINTVVRGARLSKFYLRSASTGVGKALPNSTKIPTPDGWKTVGEIQPGDYLFDAFGKPTKVLQVFPQGKKEVWQVTFKDERVAKCCDEHLWSYCTPGQKAENREARVFYTKSLKEIMKEDLGGGSHTSFKFMVPNNYAVEYPKKEYYIPPYTMGLLLGDGSFRYVPSQKALSYSSEDEELPNAIAEEMNFTYTKNSIFNYNWTFSWKAEHKKEHKNVWVEEILKDYPELWNVKSENKFIPKEYLQGSIEQRLDLLNGLLDTDGSVDAKGRVKFFTVSEQLRDNVLELAFSLGFMANYLIDTHKDTLPCYSIEITGRPSDKVKLFRLKRKHKIINDWYTNGKRKENKEFNPIIKIEDLNYQEEMTCFLVDNKEHLFLTENFIVTHNTRSMVADASYIGCSQMWDIDTQQWILTGAAQSTLYISTEQQLDEVQTMICAFISGVDEEHILYGEYEPGEWERIVKANQIIQQSKLYVVVLPDFSLQDVEDTIKREIRVHSVQYVFN